ncbi:putative glutamamyl carboxypeptidase [Trypanosoma cruzi]|uniref:Putative glutamamyl carboxypeptidase n=1 Tax=Trypanosoma cruzi TaxID=5693 RepID=A0A2V2UVY4_TRYCR|nr:putative glutamamyl carboxypeptidase [Trypanosoma cruzi]
MAARSMDHTQWLAKLVAFDTTSRNSNLELIHYCKDYLEGLVSSAPCYTTPRGTRQTCGDAAGRRRRDEGRHHSLRPHGRGPGGRAEVGQRSVYADGAGWETVRSRHVRHEGLCCRVHVSGPRAPQDEAREADPLCVVVRRGGELSRRHGAGGVCAGHDVRAEGCIIGEPTGMTVVIAHKGTSHFWVRVRGKAAHSSLALTGESCNAIDYATKLITKLREIAEEYPGTAPGMTSGAVLNAVDEPHQWRQRLEHRARGVRVPLRVSSASQTRLSPR